jgi:membrane fusion protein
MADDLFRKEAYAAQNGDEAAGATHLRQPLPIQFMVTLAALISVSMVLLLVFGQYTSKAKVRGFLEPTTGLVNVWAPHSGVVQEVYIGEGQSVQKGDPLFVIATDRASLQADDSQAQVLEQLQERKRNLMDSIENDKQLEQLDLESLDATHRKRRLEAKQLLQEIAIAEKKVASQDSVLKSYRALQKNHFISDLEADQAAHQLLEYQAALQALYKRQIILQEELDRADSETNLRRVRGEQDRNAIQRQIFTLEQEITEQHQRRASVVRAPASGSVAVLPVHLDQMVAANQKLITLVPQNTVLKATLLVPSKAAGFLRSGQSVVLRYSAFPYQKFGLGRGQVIEVDQSLTLPGEAGSPMTLDEPSYLVAVSLSEQTIKAHGTQHALKAGMALEADVRLETRTLLEWLLEPILGFGRKF